MEAEAVWRLALLVAVVVGGLVGSFLNVVAYRLPEGRSVVSPPSACPACGRGVRPWHNVPVLGWLMLRGRCADCGASIGVRYPLVEAACAALWGVLFWQMVPGVDALLDTPTLLTFGLFALYFSALLAISLIDLDHYIVPDVISLPLIPLGIAVVAMLHGHGGPVPTLPAAVFGAGLGAGLMLAIAWFGRLAFGREAMGMGDVKLVAAIGAWQGAWPTLALTIFFASLLGSILGMSVAVLRGRDKELRIPFGPYLCAGALVSWLAGDWILARWIVLPAL
ncbi:MAG: prepilin peptidase [Deltaproteobacteria bacterium]|nr:prepilin peptidase [Deltaproteobacteria bacterium]